MKKLIYLGSIVILLAAGLLSMSFLFSSESESTAASNKKESTEEKHSCCSEEEGTGELSENSIYQLESKWINQNNKPVQLSDFQGKKVVFTMFFASCTYACPILVQDMKRIESEIPPEELENFRFVLVSIDPERDTAEKLKEFSSMKNLNEKRWTLLTGSEENIMELAALTGFKYKKESDGQFSHSNIINIMNEEGEVLFQHLGLNQDITLAANYLTKE